MPNDSKYDDYRFILHKKIQTHAILQSNDLSCQGKELLSNPKFVGSLGIYVFGSWIWKKLTLEIKSPGFIGIDLKLFLKIIDKGIYSNVSV